MRLYHVVLVITLAGQAARGNVTCQNGKMISRGLSAENKLRLLAHHNYLRSQVAIGNVSTQPAAENMREFKWSNQLAKLAQNWANGCVFAHNIESYNNKSVGQNLFLGSGSNIKDRSTFFPVEDMVDSWYSELAEFGYDGTYKGETGHYSQVIWGNTRLVGCGVALYNGTKDNFIHKYLVCNYFPAGNYVNQQPYVYGNPDCSAHNLNDSTRYSGLCV